MPKLNLENLSRSTVEHHAEVFCVLAQHGDFDLLLKIGFEQDEGDPDQFYMIGDEFYFIVDTYKKTSCAGEFEAYNPHPQHDSAMDNWRCEFSWR
ncbi:MAG: hypothetical protein GWO23_15775 [Gammaproteobacteria bacterium]|nr:hypothetical protein [Gammaproteobacteria bacterium]